MADKDEDRKLLVMALSSALHEGADGRRAFLLEAFREPPKGWRMHLWLDGRLPEEELGEAVLRAGGVNVIPPSRREFSEQLELHEGAWDGVLLLGEDAVSRFLPYVKALSGRLPVAALTFGGGKPPPALGMADAVWPASSLPAQRDGRRTRWLERRLASLRPKPGPEPAGSPSADVSIIILCHNNLRYTRQCLSFLLAALPPSAEVLAFDNGSSDGTWDYLVSARRRDRRVRAFRNQENMFFARAVNIGIRKARGEFVLLLNNDVLVAPGWLEGLLRVARASRGIGAVAPCTNGTSIPWQKVPFAGSPTPSALRRFAQRHARRSKAGWVEAPWALGGCLLLRRELIEKIGLLDERFGWGGYEDLDYCFRIRQAGYKVAIARQAFVYHHLGRTYGLWPREQVKAWRQFGRQLFIDKWCFKPLTFQEMMERAL